MKAVILAAGKGKRLMPLTRDIPKCMVNICGTPIIEWNVRALERNGIKDIIIVYGYKGNVIKDYFMNAKNCNINIEFIEQSSLTGTADAIDLVKENIDDDFIVLAGDTIFFDQYIRKLFDKSNSLLYTWHYKDLEEYGTIELEKDEETIINIHEKHTNPVSEKVNISGYHFTPTIFDYIDKTPMNKGERPITDTINEMIKDGYKFYGTEVKDWNHISYPYDVERIEDDFYRRIRYDKTNNFDNWV